MLGCSIERVCDLRIHAAGLDEIVVDAGSGTGVSRVRTE